MRVPELTVAVDLSTPYAPVDSTVLVPRTGASHTMRITASDFVRHRRSVCASTQSSRKAGGRIDVLLDVIVHIAPDARTARTEAKWQPSAAGTAGGDIVYVGTASGLASLILDICAAEVADGVTVIPAATEGNSRDRCVQLLKGEVLTILEARSLVSDVPLWQHTG